MPPSLATLNKSCFEKLTEKFQYLFEPDLINEMCNSGGIKNYKEGTILMDIGQTLTHMPLVITGSVKILKEDKDGNELLLYYLELGDTCAVTLRCCTKPTKSSIKAVTETDAEILLSSALFTSDFVIN